ncbi:MAG: hypothetical protein AB7N76_16895 [Planctomycetota bacterium]
MSKPRLTVGDLRGWPQGRAAPGAAPAPTSAAWGALPPLPPALRGRGCCRRGCRGCPWAETQRAGLPRVEGPA